MKTAWHIYSRRAVNTSGSFNNRKNSSWFDVEIFESRRQNPLEGQWWSLTGNGKLELVSSGAHVRSVTNPFDCMPTITN